MTDASKVDAIPRTETAYRAFLDFGETSVTTFAVKGAQMAYAVSGTQAVPLARMDIGVITVTYSVMILTALTVTRIMEPACRA